MRRIHKLFAVGASSVLLGLMLTPAALATGTASGGAAGRAITVPNTNIKGSPAHFSPSSLSAKARWDGVQADCTSQLSFTLTNLKSVAEKVNFTGTNLKPTSFTVNPKSRFGICVPKGYTGTVHGKLTDGKKLTVTFP